jgi:DNA-binding CsgD family transcriptional regulator/PAS domain-containing protein
MDAVRAGEIIENIYTAAFEENGWDRIAQNLRVAFGASQIATCAYNWTENKLHFAHSTAGPSCASRYLNYYHKIELIVPAYKKNPQALKPFRVFSTATVLDRDEYLGSEYFQDFSRDYDMCLPLVGMLYTPGCNFTHFLVHRPLGGKEFCSEEYKLLRSLTPHLNRGLRIYRKMEGARSQAARLENVFDAHPAATFMLDAIGRVLALNKAAEELLTGGQLTVRTGRLMARHPYDDAALQGALRPPQPGLAPAEIMLRATAHAPGLRLSITPVNGGAIPMFFDVTRTARTAFVVTAVPLGPTAEHLIAAHGLSRAEAEVTLLLLRGAKAPQIAAHRDTSIATVNTQLKQIYAKTGVTGHVALLIKLLGE